MTFTPEKSYFQYLKNAVDPLMTGLAWHAEAGSAIISYHQLVMRGESELETGFRELIAAFVSGLNGCPLCSKAHKRVAELLGYSAELTEALLLDPKTAPVSQPEQLLFLYIKQLVLAPSTLQSSDAEALFREGWSERAFHDAINVTCLFNFINRFVLGHGITASDEALEASARKLARRGYG